MQTNLPIATQMAVAAPAARGYAVSRVRRSITFAVAALGLGAWGYAATPAAALPTAITASSITAGDNGSGSVTVTATVTGAGAGTTADLLCYDRGDTEAFKLASGIDVSSGSFAADVSLSPVAGRACRLRLVPSSLVPKGTDAASFNGPVISVSDRFSHSSNGNLWGYDILSGTLPTSFELQSLGECPVLASFATDPSTLGSFQLFAGNACLPSVTGVAPNPGSRSSLQVDGLNAYVPGAISKLSGVADFQPISDSPTFNSSDDEVTIDEGDTAMICGAPATFPPTSSTCPSLQPSGVAISSTTTLIDGGQVARVDQTVTNTDTRAHTVDLLFSQSVTSPASGELPGFEFPGQQTFAAHQSPDSFSQFPSGPSSIILLSDSASAPSRSNPIGAITFSRPPTSADFVSAANSQVAMFTMHYVDTLAPNTSAVYGWSFSQATSASQLSSLEALERDRFAPPQVVIGHPVNHATARYRGISVTGVAADPVGLSSLTVAGRTVPAPNGQFSTIVRLKPGKNIIQVIATNQGGQTGAASVTVTYKPLPCSVPKLRGTTLAAARHALARHDCRTGRVVHVPSSRVRKGRIVSTRPAARSKHKPFWKVRLYVSAGGRPRARATGGWLGL
jgi:hypothetical protein